MLAIVESARSIRGPVQYNEQKVKQEQARFLDAHNFLQEKEELTIRDKLQRFRELTSLNERSQKRCIHISVNFPEKDKLSDQQMKRIAADFMKAIDFGDQPWLVYRHIDVGHPHMHIVTTNIRPDGSRISNDHRSPHYLKQTCSELEQRHGLTPLFEKPDLFQSEKAAPQYEDQQQHGVRKKYLQRIIYGERPTRAAMDEVLRTVVQAFTFTSFDAYNAVLSLYNVRADRGREDSAMYRNKGLYYRLIDENGKKLGAPIKASAFHLPITLEKLEEKFKLSQQRIQESVRSIRAHIEYSIPLNPDGYSLDKFQDDLSRQRVGLVIPALRQRNPRGWQQRAVTLVDTNRPITQKPTTKPDDGHGFFYIDLNSFDVFRDTQVGERQTAAAILQRTGIEAAIRQMHSENYFELSNAQKIILRPDYPDTAEARRLLLQLSPRQSQVLALKEEQELAERRSHRMRHSL